jgi:3-dehydroquinate synthase
MDDILDRDLFVLENIALENVILKGSVVEKDPEEKNYRRCLNFGHTIGHAIEIVSGFKMYHGESVGLGILAALKISHSVNGITSKECDEAESLLSRLGVPVKVPSYIDRDLVERRLVNDKKIVDGVPYFVRIDGIGNLHVENGQYASPISKNVLKDALDYIFE